MVVLTSTSETRVVTLLGTSSKKPEGVGKHVEGRVIAPRLRLMSLARGNTRDEPMAWHSRLPSPISCIHHMTKSSSSASTRKLPPTRRVDGKALAFQQHRKKNSAVIHPTPGNRFVTRFQPSNLDCNVAHNQFSSPKCMSFASIPYSCWAFLPLRYLLVANPPHPNLQRTCVGTRSLVRMSAAFSIISLRPKEPQDRSLTLSKHAGDVPAGFLKGQPWGPGVSSVVP